MPRWLKAYVLDIVRVRDPSARRLSGTSFLRADQSPSVSPITIRPTHAFLQRGLQSPHA
jgi:hypothetical protein